MKSKRITAIIMLLVVAIAVSACGRRTEPEASEPAQLPAETVEETPYRLYDEDGVEFVYMSEEHPEVSAAKLLVEQFVGEMNTMDYRNIATDKAHPYLTQSLLEYTVADKTWEDMFANLRNVEVISESKAVEIETAMFDYDWETAYILYNSTLNILSANEKKLQETGMAMGENYERAGLQLSKENGTWKIAGFGKLD